DDNMYVFQNPLVTGGLSFHALARAFMHPDLYLWTPLTTISHMLDCEIFGVKLPGGHHLTNVLLHLTAAVLLFLVLRRATGTLWPCAFAAAVFAIHPLRVESVAWVAERKDVLSGVFFMLTLAAYLFYTRKRTAWRYALVALLFVLGLMAKQMLVTLPCVLLLLDYWPLGRIEGGDARGFFRLASEKLPLFAISAASCVQTLMIGSGVRKMISSSQFQPAPMIHPLLLRLENGVVCYVVYIWQMFYPANLSVYYPYPDSVPLWQALGALALLAGISAAAIVLRRAHPALFTGWFWYLGMMIPVIGFVPVGREGHADRYTYLPQIGLCIAIAWLCAAACERVRIPRTVTGGAMAAVIVVLAFCAHRQASYWSTDQALWTHALEATPVNAFANNNLGLDLAASGDIDGAIRHYQAALAVQPDYIEARNNMGIALCDEGNVEGAIAEYHEALNTKPDYPDALNNLGRALFLKGDLEGSIEKCRKAVELDPNFSTALNNLGNALSARAQDDKDPADLEQAIAAYRRALDIQPGYADAHSNLATDLMLLGRTDEAAAEYRKALDANPNLPNAWFRLANLRLHADAMQEALTDFQNALQCKPGDTDVEIELAYVLAAGPHEEWRNGKLALKIALAANVATGGNNPSVLRSLAAAYAETEHYPQAEQVARRALELIPDSKADSNLADDLRSDIALYKNNMPLRDASMIAPMPVPQWH
ncbi:MAG TPA: tetratricopeptide repeat protein, partial [Chthoniobacteraceae bacterium]|nr:tetratricopeptide repeat protein [Chthoniobacteraceae bacterium]